MEQESAARTSVRASRAFIPWCATWCCFSAFGAVTDLQMWSDDDHLREQEEGEERAAVQSSKEEVHQQNRFVILPSSGTRHIDFRICYYVKSKPWSHRHNTSFEYLYLVVGPSKVQVLHWAPVRDLLFKNKSPRGEELIGFPHFLHYFSHYWPSLNPLFTPYM